MLDELNEKQKATYNQADKSPKKYSDSGVRFVVLNRASATNPETYKNANIPYIVISIGGVETPEWEIPVNEKCLSVLKVRFDDISYSPKDTFHFYDRPTKKITEEDAIVILNFVFLWVPPPGISSFASKSLYKDDYIAKQIVVNCHAGLSRSTGVALALSMILNGYDAKHEQFIESIAGLQFANLLIRDTILKVYNEKY